MAGLVSLIGHRPSTAGSPLSLDPMVQLARLEEAAGFSMVSFEADDDDFSLDSERKAPHALTAIADRLTTLLDDCTKHSCRRIWRTAA